MSKSNKQDNESASTENPSTQIADRALSQFMEIWILPEVSRRQAAAELPKPVDLMAAQIVFYPDGKRPLVRLNDEVKAKIETRLKSGTIEAGTPVYASQIDEILNIRLSEPALVDCGHVTILRMADTWHLAFDFRYNKELSQKHLNTAKQFYDVASLALDAGHLAAFIDNLFSASQLAAKALLLSMPDPRLRKKTTHNTLRSKFNQYARLGNVEPDQTRVFNKLQQLRGNARYLRGELRLELDEAIQMLQTVSDLICSVETNINPGV